MKCKSLKWTCSALTGLLVSSAALADTTNLICVTDFEPEGNRPPWGGYGYYYQWPAPNPGAWFQTDSWHLDAPDYTNTVFRFYFENSLFDGYMAANPSGGYGTGIGLPQKWIDPNPATLSTNRGDYILSFDARVEGLVETQSTANIEIQMMFRAPDGTRPPTNGDGDNILQINNSRNIGSNWTHIVIDLGQGGLGDNTTEELFAQHIALVNEIRFACNKHIPDAQFGCDYDNTVFFDNIELRQITRDPTVVLPKAVAGAIFDWNMDDKTLWYGWGAGANGGWSAINEAKASYFVNQPVEGAGVNGSRALEFAMHNDVFASLETLPAWAGGNGGFGGPANYSLVSSTNMEDYVFSVDLRAEGLHPDATQTAVDFQLHVNTPDGTMSASNNAVDRIARLDFRMSGITSNWTRKEIALNRATFGDGSTKANWDAYHKFISEIAVQIQFNNVVSSNTWSFDQDNKVFFDNIKLERLVVGCPPLIVTTAGSDLVVTWAQPNVGSVKLQSATAAAGPYTDVANATNPYNTPLVNAPKYFRTIWVPPSL